MTQKPRTRSRVAAANGLFNTTPTSQGEISDENVWEDIPEADGARLRGNSPLTSVRVTPRKRKPLHKSSYTTSPRKTPSTPASKPKAEKEPQLEIKRPIIPTDDIVDGARDGIHFTIRYALDIFRTAIHLLRKPLAILLFLWLLAIILARISHIISSAFAPLCILPGLSSSRLCHYSNPSPYKKPQWADYPKLVAVQSKTFEELLDETVGGTGLSLEIKKAELATTDLITVVRVSRLKSRELLADTLRDFVNDAKATGRGLQRLTSRIGGAIDGIMAVNDYALTSIQEAQVNAPSPYSLKALVPWSKVRPTSEVITATFTEAMESLSNNIGRLIVEAEISHSNLNNLEERLTTLYEIVSREDSSISSEKDELLAELWTKLGGNKKTLRGFESHLSLLKELGKYRKQALVHVVAALQSLQAMSEDMSELRERVASPELVGSSIPVEVHIKSISNGLERLREGRIRAKTMEEDAVRRVLEIASDSDEI